MKTLLISCFVLAMLSGALAGDRDRARVYVSDSKSWEIKAGAGGSVDGFGGAGGGGDRPQTAEIIKTFNERCPQVIINSNKDKADYIVLLDHEGGKDVISRDNKVVVFNREGDAIMSKSTRLLGNAVKDACLVITQTWSGEKVRARYAQPEDQSQARVEEKK